MFSQTEKEKYIKAIIEFSSCCAKQQVLRDKQLNQEKKRNEKKIQKKLGGKISKVVISMANLWKYEEILWGKFY